jgi:transposase
VEENVETLPPRTEAVGLDAGITSLVTLSTGEKIANPKTFDKHCSKRCSSCGYIAEKMPLSIREWECPECGTHHDRDWNAAKNILAAGHAVSVCGATVRPKRSNSGRAGAMKQKA